MIWSARSSAAGSSSASGTTRETRPICGGLARGDVAAREHDLEGARAADRARQQEREPELGRGEAVVDAGGAEVGRLARRAGCRRRARGTGRRRSRRRSPRRSPAAACAASPGTSSARIVMARVAMRVSVRPAMLGGGVDVLLVGARAEAAARCRSGSRTPVSLSAATAASASCSGTTSSKAIEFMRSGRSITITLVRGRGFSMRTKLMAGAPRRPSRRRSGSSRRRRA